MSPVAVDETTTRAEALARLRRGFAQAGIAEAALDARILLLDSLGIDATELALRPDMPLGPSAARLTAWAERRLAREPVARIVGLSEFWGLPFRLSPETLVPRPDTEALVEAVLACVTDRAAPLRIVDLGTGSGCILVALLRELPRAWGLGLDRAFGALAAARENASRNGVGERAAFVASDWAAAIRGPFDIVVSNPPYIPSPVIAELEPEVRVHDPVAALDGGADGFCAYRTILDVVPGLLRPGGLVALEAGIGQAEGIADLARAGGLDLVRFQNDLAGIPRAVVAAKGS